MFERARLRLTAWYVSLLALLLIVFDVGVLSIMNQGLQANLADDLQRKASQASAAIVDIGSSTYFDRDQLASDPGWADVSLFATTTSGTVSANLVAGSVLPNRSAMDQAMAGRHHPSRSDLSCRGLHAVNDGVGTRVADDMETGLYAGQRAGSDVVTNLLDGEVSIAAVGLVEAVEVVVAVDVRHAQGRGPRADRAVDVEVPGQAAHAMALDQRASLCLVRHELGPVADDLRAVASLPGREDIDKVCFRAELGPAVLVHQADAGSGRSLQGGVDVGTTVRRTDAFAKRLPCGVVGLARHQAAVVPAGQVAHSGGGRQGRRDDRRVAVDARRVDHPAVGRTIELRSGVRPMLGPVILVPAGGVDRTSLAPSGSVLDPGQSLFG